MIDTKTWARRACMLLMLTLAASALSACRNGAIQQYRPEDMKSLWRTAPAADVLAGGEEAPSTGRGPGR